MTSKKPTLALKKIFIFIFLLISALALTACSNTTGKPNGNIDDSTFASISDDYKVTNKELYNALRPGASSVLRQMFDKQLFKDQLATVNAINTDTDKEYVKHIESKINTAIFKSTSVEAIAKMTDRAIAQAILTYVDSFMIAYPNTNRANLSNFLDGVVSGLSTKFADWKANEEAAGNEVKAENYVFGYFVKDNAISQAIVEPFKLDYAKRLYATPILDKEVLDVNSASYIKESDLVSYYKSDLIGKDPVSAVIVPFSSVKENQEARYFFQVKSNTKGEWYQLPDILSEAGFNQLKAATADETSNNPYAYAKDVFNKLDNYNDVDSFTYTSWAQTVSYKTAAYASFYEKYNTSKVGERQDVKLNAQDSTDNFKDDEILKLFLAMNDFLNETSYTDLPANPENSRTIDLSSLEITIASKDDLLETFERAYTDGLFSVNTSLRTEIYNIAKNHTDETKNLTRYSKQPQTLGNASFLIYVLETLEDPKDILDKNESTDEETFLDNEAANAYKEKARLAVYASRLTDSFVTTQVTKLYTDDAKINIYDYIIRTFYEQSYGYKGSNGYKNNNIVADVNGFEITVDALFEELAKTSGLSTALDLIMTKVLEDKYENTIDKDKMATLKKTFENTLSQFKANAFESNGFPSSLGLNKFLLLAFEAESSKEAFQKSYIDSEYRTSFKNDYDNHYTNKTDDNIYKKWATLSEKPFDAYMGIETSHLLISLDRNFDGSPDDINELKTTDLAEFNRLTTLAGELAAAIKERAIKKAVINATTLQEIVAEYTDATRFPYADDAEIYPNTSVWAKFKRAGFSLKFESLGNVTNLTNSTGSEQQFVNQFFDYTIGLTNKLVELKKASNETDPDNGNIKDIFPFFAPNPGSTNIAFDVKDTQSEFGWHLLLVTNLLETTSSKVTSESYVSEFRDTTITVSEGEEQPFLNAKNDRKYLSYQQIMIHLKESGEETGVESLPSDVKTAITNYFTPVKTLYDADSHQLDLLLRLLANTKDVTKNSTIATIPTITSSYNAELLNNQLVSLFTSNRNQMFSYSIFKDAAAGSLQARANDSQYASVYGDWFTVLERA